MPKRSPNEVPAIEFQCENESALAPAPASPPDKEEDEPGEEEEGDIDVPGVSTAAAEEFAGETLEARLFNSRGSELEDEELEMEEELVASELCLCRRLTFPGWKWGGWEENVNVDGEVMLWRAWVLLKDWRSTRGWV
jgi:hypothetical protein